MPESAARSPLAGRVAVVTGGGRGVGAAIAARLGADGARIIVAARSSEQLRAVAERLRADGTTAHPVVCDVSDPEAIQRLAQIAQSLEGRVDILINNAGLASAAPLLRTTLDEWNTALAVNATSAFLCLKAFLPDMIAAGWGRVVNVASTAALSGDRYIAAYAASKHALVGLTRCAAVEVAMRGVTVNAVCPGFVATDMTEQSLARIVAATGRSRDDATTALVRKNPQGRLFDPEEVAAATAYLCSDAARGVNGATIVIDGGEGAQ
jgi:NAD(P)-dependent dehydrogenase (short-subunit alcohol dehydrogenase family)